jgi:hypothetical protein
MVRSKTPSPAAQTTEAGTVKVLIFQVGDDAEGTKPTPRCGCGRRPTAQERHRHELRTILLTSAAQTAHAAYRPASWAQQLSQARDH